MKSKLKPKAQRRRFIQSAPVTIERLERGLAPCAYLVVRDGAVVIPLFESLERDLAAMRSNEATVARAKALLVR